MKILIMHDTLDILAWLCDTPLELVPVIIQNGYPHLQNQWDAGTLTAVILDVPLENAFKSDLYEVRDNLVQLKIT